MKIIFEDSEILILDKPAGIVVNRAATVSEETVQDFISDYLKLGDSLGIGDRAGIVHRIDRETSGILLVAKTQKVFDLLQEEFANRVVKKEYVALSHGKFDEANVLVDKPIGRVGGFGKFGIVNEGRDSLTYFKVDACYSLKEMVLEGLIEEENKNRKNYFRNHAVSYTLLTVSPQTGRTHQIRVHLKSLGNPIVSDLIYAPGKLLKLDLLWCPRLFLHAKKIEFKHPKTGKYVSFEAKLPKDLGEALKKLEKISS